MKIGILADRRVNSLDTSLDPENYQDIPDPVEVIEYRSILEKATRQTPEVTMTWTNQKPGGRTGRQARYTALHWFWFRKHVTNIVNKSTTMWRRGGGGEGHIQLNVKKTQRAFEQFYN